MFFRSQGEGPGPRALPLGAPLNALTLNVLWTKISSGGSVKNSWTAAFVSQSVSMCVQTFSGITPERLVRSGPVWGHSTHQNGGTTMVPVMSRLVAHGTWHMPPRKGLQKFIHAPGVGWPLFFEFFNFYRDTPSSGSIGYKNKACKIFLKNNFF